MSKNKLPERILLYRRKKGLSQEKVSEYMGVSRQAVTKWENGISRPSSDHLIRLAQLFEIKVDVLLGNEEEKILNQAEISTGRTPWIFIGISFLCMFVYIIAGARLHIFSMGVFICMFVLCVPIQLFLHIYLSDAIKNNSFSGIAGFDYKVEYNIQEVKKMLIRMNLHINVISTVSVFLLCAINCMNLQIKWLNGILIVVYLLNFIAGIGRNNYKMTDKIYCREDDKKRAKKGMTITLFYFLLLFTGIGMAGILFEVKGIENNTLPAMKTGGFLLLGVLSATISFLWENHKIKKWNPADADYRMSKAGITGLVLCMILYGLMCG